MAQNIVVLITGANTGLGLQIVRALYSSENYYHILLAGRSLGKASQAAATVEWEFQSSNSVITPIIVDIESDESIQSLFDEVQSRVGRLDVLINNAGAQLDQQYHAGALTMREMWIKSWNINTVGTQMMTSTFVPLLLKSSSPRILFLTSGTSTLQGSENLDLPINKSPDAGWPKAAANSVSNIAAYRSSKCGMNMMMREWHRTLLNDNVKVHTISPGFLATGLGGNTEASKAAGAGDPALAGGFVRDVVEGKRDADVGKVITRQGVQDW